VKTTCNGLVYRMGAALLDLDEPWKIVARADSYLLGPETPYECMGDVPNVVFPTGLMCDSATGRLAFYYGAADTSTCLAFAHIDELVQFIHDHKS
jgi:beta-1,4-mannooligosaccharide/beta-1,4-mannosyl-N-acetylglucosamine phosphorylase